MIEKQKVSLNSSQVEPIENVDFRLLPLREICRHIVYGLQLLFHVQSDCAWWCNLPFPGICSPRVFLTEFY